MKDRLRMIRNSLGMTQTEFAKSIGMTRSMISNLELGAVDIADYFVELICAKFGISEKWFRTGEGEMRIQTEDAHLTALVEKYQLDGLDRLIMEKYMALPSTLRDVFKDFIMDIAKDVITSATPAAPVYPGIPAIDDALRAELDRALEEYNASHASGTTNSPA